MKKILRFECTKVLLIGILFNKLEQNNGMECEYRSKIQAPLMDNLKGKLGVGRINKMKILGN